MSMYFIQYKVNQTWSTLNCIHRWWHKYINIQQFIDNKCIYKNVRKSALSSCWPKKIMQFTAIFHTLYGKPSHIGRFKWKCGKTHWRKLFPFNHKADNRHMDLVGLKTEIGTWLRFVTLRITFRLSLENASIGKLKSKVFSSSPMRLLVHLFIDLKLAQRLLFFYISLFSNSLRLICDSTHQTVFKKCKMILLAAFLFCLSLRTLCPSFVKAKVPFGNKLCFHRIKFLSFVWFFFVPWFVIAEAIELANFQSPIYIFHSNQKKSNKVRKK